MARKARILRQFVVGFLVNLAFIQRETEALLGKFFNLYYNTKFSFLRREKVWKLFLKNHSTIETVELELCSGSLFLPNYLKLRNMFSSSKNNDQNNYFSSLKKKH